MICVELPAGGFWSSDCKKNMVCDFELSKCAQYLDALLLVLIVHEIDQMEMQKHYTLYHFLTNILQCDSFTVHKLVVLLYIFISVVSLNFETGC